MNEFIYGEPADYEFMGVSLQSDYEVEKTIYISDMTKPIKSRNLEIGRETKNSNEIVLSKTTATHLNPDYQKLLNQQLYGYYLKDDQIKGVSLTVVGIGKDVTAFDTIYINELANLDHISQAFAIDKKQLLFQLAMINLNSKADLDDLLMDLEDQYSQFEFKVAGENINERIDTFMLQIQRVLLLFSLLAIVAACFLIGEVLYLSVIEKTKDIGIFKCMGASKLQIMNLVLLESFTLISGAFICSYVFFIN
ncbi:MAG: ABC transporter permease [Thomasclavelia ramosa]